MLRSTDLPPGPRPAPSLSISSFLRITAILQIGSDYIHLTDEKREVQEGHIASQWQNLDLNSNLPTSKPMSFPLHCIALNSLVLGAVREARTSREMKDKNE